MSKVGFFSGLDAWERRAINNLDSELSRDITNVANVQAEGFARSRSLVERLFALDKAQAKEIRELRAALSVLLDMLADAGQLDRDVFSYRVEAEIDRVHEEAQKELADANMVTCGQCRGRFDKSYTQISELGPICDRCFYQQP